MDEQSLKEERLKLETLTRQIVVWLKHTFPKKEGDLTPWTKGGNIIIEPVYQFPDDDSSLCQIEVKFSTEGQSWSGMRMIIPREWLHAE